MGERIAIRSLRRGPAHIWDRPYDNRTWRWYDTICGRSMSDPERILWESTAPEDRCRTCAASLAAEGGADRG